MDLTTFQHHGLHRSLWDQDAGIEVNGRTNLEIMAALDLEADRSYQPCVEAGAPARHPAGRVHRFGAWESCRYYPGTTRDISVYLPSDIGDGEAGLAVFQDGAAYLDPAGPVRATAVFESLIADGAIRPLVGVFIGAGRISGGDELTQQRQRSVEYDTCSATYGTFLVEELLPFVVRDLGVRLSADPARRLIAGISSGGICAFNAAWHAPEQFGRVLSHCGSFTNIRGAHNYPYLVRTTPRKPIRVFLQSGAGDADILYGSWPDANKTMAAALEFAGYQVRFEFGVGGHSLRHGGALFADALRWLFTD